MLKQEGVDWFSYPEYFKSGAILKKGGKQQVFVISGAILGCLSLSLLNSILYSLLSSFPSFHFPFLSLNAIYLIILLRFFEQRRGN